MIEISIVILCLSIAIMMFSAFKKSIALSKVVSLNCVTSYVIALISLFAFTDENRIYFFDVAIIYGVIGFVSSVAYLKYLKYKR